MNIKTKRLTLSPELEKPLLAGLIWGAVPPEAIKPEELSGPGRSVHRAVSDAFLSGGQPPFSLPSILLALTDVYGINQGTAKAYLESIHAALPAADGAEAVVRKLRQKHSLLSLANAAMGQLQKGEYSPEELSQVLAATSTAGKPVPLSEVIRDGLPPPPSRLEMYTLPQLSERLGGGLVGLTVFSGEPAVGKSTLVWQVALDVGREIPVIYYDLDNGLPTLMDRTRWMFGDDLGRIQKAVGNIYLRDSVRTLDSDLVYIPSPALVVVDIFQALPTSLEFERQGLGHWIHRLGALRRKGYHVLVVSEVQRFNYGNVSLGGFKGTGEIEYTADLACQLIPTSTGAEVHIVKNRHGERKGLVATLRRERGFWWREYVDESFEGLFQEPEETT